MKLVLNDEGADIVGPVQELTGGRGADVVIEAVGVPEVWQLAIKVLRRGGVVNFFGGCPDRHRSRGRHATCCITPS